MELAVKLKVFEGPLDLLLHLIEKDKLDIYDIPIAEITDQYMEYISSMDMEDLDLASEFLVMAATLLDIKSRMLLPADEEEEKIPEKNWPGGFWNIRCLRKFPLLCRNGSSPPVLFFTGRRISRRRCPVTGRRWIWISC